MVGAMVEEVSTSEYEVVGRTCAIRQEPSTKSEPVGDIPQGKLVRGFACQVDGAIWVRLAEADACRYVPVKEERRSGCWVPEEHPVKGTLLRPRGARIDHASASRAEDGSSRPSKRLELRIKNAYEAALECEWFFADQNGPLGEEAVAASEATLEVAAGAGAVRAGLLLPREGVQVRRVTAGAARSATVQGLQAGAEFLVAVSLAGAEGLRTAWLRATTLSVESRDKSRSELQGLDPTGCARGTCTRCACEGYVPVSRRHDGISAFFNCRRCACRAESHREARTRTAEEEARMLRLVDEQEAERARAEQMSEELRCRLREAEQAARQRLSRPVAALPWEAADWSERERNLWFWSEGLLHPRECRHAARSRRPVRRGEEKAQWEEQAARALARGEPAGCGKASVVSPTTQARQKFHKQLWSSFVQQDWPDKELIVIETYEDTPSEFFSKLDGEDGRLVFLSFKVAKARDLSIGAKRNMGQHVAMGDYIVNFDDDDLYAPSYITSMVGHMEKHEADLVTLSTWHVFDANTGQVAYSDPEQYAALTGRSCHDSTIQGWLWGYGFSYVHRLDPALEAGINYPERNLSEDLTFFQALRRHCGEERSVLMQDVDGICLHVLHGGNQSASFCVREVHAGLVRSLEVGEQFQLQFSDCLRRKPTRSRWIRFPAGVDEPG